MAALPVWFVQVARSIQVTPKIRRITFAGEDLAAYRNDEPDQQVKLYFPKPGQLVPILPKPHDDDVMRWYEAYTAIPEDERPWMRGFTIRGHDPERATIDIDFVLHDDPGPAVKWALSAVDGDTIGVYGPSATFARRVPLSQSVRNADWLLLAGDETALPAMSTVIEWLPEGSKAVAYIEVRDQGEEQVLGTRGDLTTHWLHRGGTQAGTSDLLLSAVRDAQFPSGSPFAWIAGEAGAVRTIRRHLVGDRGMDKRSIDFEGYWRYKLTQDDAPTDEDMSDAQEKLAEAGQGW